MSSRIMQFPIIYQLPGGSTVEETIRAVIGSFFAGVSDETYRQTLQRRIIDQASDHLPRHFRHKSLLPLCLLATVAVTFVRPEWR
jgi:hypothetical protein